MLRCAWGIIAAPNQSAVPITRHGTSTAVLTGPITRLGSKASKSAHLSEQALGSHDGPLPSKLMTRV
jgi:hypothetical protein